MVLKHVDDGDARLAVQLGNLRSLGLQHDHQLFVGPLPQDHALDICARPKLELWPEAVDGRLRKVALGDGQNGQIAHSGECRTGGEGSRLAGGAGWQRNRGSNVTQAAICREMELDLVAVIPRVWRGSGILDGRILNMANAAELVAQDV